MSIWEAKKGKEKTKANRGNKSKGRGKSGIKTTTRLGNKRTVAARRSSSVSRSNYRATTFNPSSFGNINSPEEIFIEAEKLYDPNSTNKLDAFFANYSQTLTPALQGPKGITTVFMMWGTIIRAIHDQIIQHAQGQLTGQSKKQIKKQIRNQFKCSVLKIVDLDPLAEDTDASVVGLDSSNGDFTALESKMNAFIKEQIRLPDLSKLDSTLHLLFIVQQLNAFYEINKNPVSLETIFHDSEEGEGEDTIEVDEEEYRSFTPPANVSGGLSDPQVNFFLELIRAAKE